MRYDLPGGDFDRVRRQQNYLRAMFSQLFSQDVFTSPGKLDATLLSVTSAVAVDDGLSNGGMLSLAYSMRGLRPDDVEFFTAPVLGTGREGPASVVYLDQVAGQRMWGYLQTDSLGQNTDEFADELLVLLRERLAHYKCPRSISFEAQLPRTDTGKLYKQELIEKYS